MAIGWRADETMRERGERMRSGQAEALRLVGGAATATGAESALVVAAREEVRRRADRRMVFEALIPSEPGWDMMLDLYLARAVGRQVSVSSLCVAAGVPTTTALRWIRVLEEAGMLLRRRDRQDARRSFVDLSPLATERLELLLRRAIQSGAG